MMNSRGPSNMRYKTMMCKHFSTEEGCQYGDKCQFAHGVTDLRTQNNPMGQDTGTTKAMQQQKSAMNYKIVKCKNFEKEGQCKYGTHCTFAHGDAELRSKNDQMMGMGMGMGMGIGMNANTQPSPMMMYSQQMYDLMMMNQMQAMGQMPQMPMDYQPDPNMYMMGMPQEMNLNNMNLNNPMPGSMGKDVDQDQQQQQQK